MHKLKVGDRVRITKYQSGHLVGTVGVIHQAGLDGSFEVKANGECWFASADAMELVNAETPDLAATKHWFICVLDAQGQPLPATKPRLYSTAEQARAVARTMAEGRKGRYVVYEATDVAVSGPRTVVVNDTVLTPL